MKNCGHHTALRSISIRFGAVLILMIGLLGSVAVTPARAASLIVPDQFSTIQAALNAAAPGDFIFVRAGTYPEHVVITKPVTLNGENRATIVDGGGAGTVFFVNAPNVTISGFTVRNAVRGIHYVASSNGRIADVLVTGGSESGIFLQQSNYILVEGSTITASGMGINLGDQGSNHITIQQVNVYSNTITGITGYSGSFYITVRDSSVHDNPSGFSIGWSQFWDISDTDIYANPAGIYLDTDSNLTIRNCDFHGGNEGIAFTGFYGDSNLIEGNRFYQNATAGINFRNDAHNNTIRSNDFYDNNIGVRISSSTRASYNNTFYQNIFIDNTVNAQIELLSAGNTWDNGYPGGGNYWDDYTGGDIFNGAAQNVVGRDGIGDSPYVIVPSNNIDRYPLIGLYAVNDSPMLLGNVTHFAASTLLNRAFTYTWAFGDGATGAGASASHTYASHGHFTATCTASIGGVELHGTTPVTITYIPHTNADLSSLVLSSGALTPAFATGTTTYTQSVGNAVTSLTVTPTVADTTATVTVNGSPVASGVASSPISLAVGENIITTIVTAEDGTTTKTYTVTVTRAPSSNANLSSLVFSTGALTPVFDDDTITYTQSVGNAVASLTVTPTVADTTAHVTVNGSPVVSGSPSSAIPLAVGENIITTIVTAQDGTTTKTYTVTVTRAASANADLSSLELSTGALTPVFDDDTTAYTQSVGNAVTSLTVTPTVADETAAVTVNGSPVASGSASGAIALALGDNVITVVVTAEDGVTTKTYTVTVTRAGAANADLSNLELSTGAFSPAFDAGTTAYTQSVGGRVASLTVTPTVADAAATVTVNSSPVASGSASDPIALAPGSNTITVVVTAQDGVTTKTYTVTVRRDYQVFMPSIVK